MDQATLTDLQTELQRPDYAGLRSSGKGQWSFRARRKIIWLSLAIMLVAPLQAGLRYLPGSGWWHSAGFFHRFSAWCFGIRITTSGSRQLNKPTLYVSNHISWLDILVLGGSLPRAQFVAKSDIQGWGVLGWLCRLHRTVFVNRDRRQDSANQLQQMLEPFRKGNSLILFPEGTTSLGQKVLPFRSSLFAVADAARKDHDLDIAVQPVSVSFSSIDGIPLTRARRSQVAWIGDMELVDHARDVFSKGLIRVHLHFHEPASEEVMANRKKLAAYCQSRISNGLARLHRQQLPLG